MRRSIITATLVVTALAFMGARADNIQNDVVAGGNDTITAGGSTTINYRVAANNGDGQNGCNAADSTPPTVTINAPAGVTATPDSVTITGCGDENEQPVTFTSSAVGSHEITVGVSDAGAGTYNTNPAKFTLHVNASPPPSNTPPVLTLADVGFEGNALGGRSGVTFNMSAADAEDGSLTLQIVCSHAEADFYPLGSTTVSCSVTDSGGLSDSGTFTVTVVDTTAPEVSVPVDITTAPTAYNGAVVSYSGESAYDIVDGVVAVSCSPASGSLFGFGPNLVTCSAQDASGNVGLDSFTITVTGFVFDGFFSPIDNGVWNTVKGGSTVPVKWRLWGANGQITDTRAVQGGGPAAAQVGCTGGGEDAIEATATGGTSLRYDTTGQQFIYNWQTPRTSNKCYILIFAFTDGTTQRVQIKTK